MYRSRLQRVEEKRNVRKAVLLLGGTLLTIGLIAIWGVPLLVKMAVFFGNLNSSRRPIDKNDLIPPAPPTILMSFEATNSAQQVIRGWSEPGSTVFLTQNATVTGSVVVKEDGGFQFGKVSLSDGKNEFIAVAVDGGGNKSLESAPVVIQYWNKTPKLDVSQPVDRQHVTGKEASVEVKGQTDPGVRLLINDRVVVLSGDGSFVVRQSLIEGENNIIIEAIDRAGNKLRKEMVVTYSP